MMNALSQTENKDLMAQAREALKGNWGLAIGANVIYCVIVLAVQSIPKVGGGIGIIVGAPMIVGVASFSLSLARKQEVKLVQIFDGIKKFWSCLGTYLLVMIFIILWTLLLIIPGIMAAYSYAMVYFILADNDSIGPLEAIAKSKEMMRGNRWKLFCLGLRFIGWAIVCLLTLGIGFLWLLPYLYVAGARFYDDIKPTAEEIELTATCQVIMP
jgi:uncharacterized membrane protein